MERSGLHASVDDGIDCLATRDFFLLRLISRLASIRLLLLDAQIGSHALPLQLKNQKPRLFGRVRRSDQQAKMTKCLIVGGGPVGALAALYAANRGWQVELYELRGGL